MSTEEQDAARAAAAEILDDMVLLHTIPVPVAWALVDHLLWLLRTPGLTPDQALGGSA